MDDSLFELLCSVEKKNDGNHWILSLIHSLGCVVLAFEEICVKFPKGRVEYWYELPGIWRRNVSSSFRLATSFWIFDAWNASVCSDLFCIIFWYYHTWHRTCVGSK